MKILIDRACLKDINKVKDKLLLENLNSLILVLEAAETFDEFPNIKKLRGYKSYFRIRIGDYRLGFEKVNEEKICLIRFLHRKDIYKYFPKK